MLLEDFQKQFRSVSPEGAGSIEALTKAVNVGGAAAPIEQTPVEEPLSKVNGALDEILNILKRAPQEAGGQIGKAAGGVLRMAGDLAGRPEVAGVGAAIGDYYAGGQKALEKNYPVESIPGKVFDSALSSTIMQAPMVGAGLWTALTNPIAVPSVVKAGLAGMGVVEGGSSYQDFRSKGVPVGTAAIGAVTKGTAEAVFEMAPLGEFLKFGTQPLLKTLVSYGIKELGGEMSTTLTQDVVDKLVENPEANKAAEALQKYFWNHGDVAGSEFVANELMTIGTTLTQTLLMGGAGKAGNMLAKAVIDRASAKDPSVLDTDIKDIHKAIDEAKTASEVVAGEKTQTEGETISKLRDQLSLLTEAPTQEEIGVEKLGEVSTDEQSQSEQVATGEVAAAGEESPVDPSAETVQESSPTQVPSVDGLSSERVPLVRAPNVELVASALQHFANPIQGDTLVVSSPSLLAESNFAEDLLISTGVKAHVGIFTQEDLAANPELQTIAGGAGEALLSRMSIGNKEGSIAKLTTPEGNKYVIIIGDTNKAGVERLEVITHEAVGHIVAFEKYDLASVEQKAAIEKDFQDFVHMQLGAKTKEERAALAQEFFPFNIGKKATDLNFGYSTQLQEGTNVGKEWIANQITKWATTDKKPLTLADKWFKKLANQLKRIFAKAQSQRQGVGLPVQSVSDWLNSIFDPSRLDSIDNSNVKMIEEKPALDSKGKDSTKKQMEILKKAVSKEDLDRFSVGKAVMSDADEKVAKALRAKIKEATSKGMLSINTEELKQELKVLEGKYKNAVSVSVTMDGGTKVVIKTITSTSRSTAQREAELFKLRAAAGVQNIVQVSSPVTARAEYYRMMLRDFKTVIQEYADDHGMSFNQTWLKFTSDPASFQSSTEASEMFAALDHQGQRIFERISKVIKHNPEGARKALLYDKRVVPVELQEVQKEEVEIKKDLQQNPPVVEKVKRVRKKKDTIQISNGNLEELISAVNEQVDEASISDAPSTTFEGRIRDAAQEAIIGFIQTDTKINLDRVQSNVLVKLNLRGEDAKLAKSWIAENYDKLKSGQVVEVKDNRQDKEQIPDDVSEDEALEFLQSIDDLIVYHGTSKVIQDEYGNQDVPSVKYADPNGLYGPGVYMTEDALDEDGHLIVTAGYAGDIKSIPELTEAVSALYDLAHSGRHPELLARLRTVATYDETSEEYTNPDAIFELYNEYVRTNPNIQKLVIDPKPDEVFDIDKEYTEHDISENLQDAVGIVVKRDGSFIYHELQFGAGNSYLNTLREIDNKDYIRLAGIENKKEFANAILLREGFNFITHTGGGITGGVSHKVWIALKDGLVKSAFEISDIDVRSQPFNPLYRTKLTEQMSIELGWLRPAIKGTTGLVTTTRTNETHYEAAEKQPRGAIPGEELGGRGYVTPDGKFLNDSEVLNWIKDNQPEVYKQLKNWKIEHLDNDDYLSALQNLFGVSDLAVKKTKEEIEAEKIADTLFRKAKKVRKKKVLTEEELAKKEAARLERRSKKEKETREMLLGLISAAETAKVKGLSLTEYLKASGFSEKDNIKMVRLYLQHQGSIFSQREQILRLAIDLGMYNSVEGDKGLIDYIKSVFPESYGTLDTIGIRGRDILVHRLQQMHEKMLGSELDFTTVETLKDVKAAKDKAFESLSMFQKSKIALMRLIGNMQDGLNSTPAGSQIVWNLKQIMSAQYSLYARDYMTKLDGFKKDFESVEARVEIGRRYREGLPGRSEKEIKAIALFKSIATSYGKEMERLGFKIFYDSKHQELFKHDPSVPYFPRMWEPGAFDNKNTISKMIDHLVRSGQAINEKEARKIVNRFKNKYNRLNVPMYANMEMARETDIGGWIEDPAEVFGRYVISGSRRLAVMRVLGSTAEAKLVSMARDHFNQSNDPASLTDAVNVINSVIGSGAGGTKDLATSWIADEAQFYAISTMLQHSNILQPGVSANVVGRIGLKNTLRGFKQILAVDKATREQNKARAFALGVAEKFIAKELFDDLKSDTDARSRADKLLGTWRVTGIDRWMRAGTALGAQMHIMEKFTAFLQGDGKAERDLRRLFIDPKLMKADLDSGNEQGLKDWIDMGSFQLTQQTNFATDALTSPQLTKDSNSPWLNLITLFSRFSFHQSKFLADQIKNDPKKLLVQILSQTSIGAPIYLLRLLAKGVDPEKELEKDGLLKSLWKMFLSGSGLGLFAEMAISAVMDENSNSGGAPGPVLGSTVKRLKDVRSIGKDIITDNVDDQTYSKAIQNLYDAGIYGIARYAPPAIGIPVAAGLGFAGPAIKRNLAPTQSQGETNWTGG